MFAIQIVIPMCHHQLGPEAKTSLREARDLLADEPNLQLLKLLHEAETLIGE